MVGVGESSPDVPMFQASRLSNNFKRNNRALYPDIMLKNFIS